MAENGVDRTDAALMFVALSALVTGLLIDRMPSRFLLSGALALITAAMFTAHAASTTAAVGGFGVLLGGMQGHEPGRAVDGLPTLFRSSPFRGDQGLTTTVMVAGTAAGPLLVAWGLTSVAGTCRSSGRRRQSVWP